MKSEESNGSGRRESRIGWNFADSMCGILQQSGFSMLTGSERPRQKDGKAVSRTSAPHVESKGPCKRFPSPEQPYTPPPCCRPLHIPGGQDKTWCGASIRLHGMVAVNGPTQDESVIL